MHSTTQDSIKLLSSDEVESMIGPRISPNSIGETMIYNILSKPYEPAALKLNKMSSP